MNTKIILTLALFTVMVASSSSFAVTQQSGAVGKIMRMITNHNANNDEIYITTSVPGYPCNAVTLRTNDPNVSATSYKTLYAHLLAAKLSGKTVELYTDLSCNLFRVEIID